MKSRFNTTRCVVTAVMIAALGELAVAADPPKLIKPPTADEVMIAIGLSGDDRSKVLASEYVTSDAAPLSGRDSPLAITFLAKGSTPEALAQEIAPGAVVSADPHVRKSGPFRGAGGLVDVSRIRLEQALAMKYAGARAGTAFNLSTAEAAAFSAIPNTNPGAAGLQLQKMLVDRFHAYKSAGLAGIAPYDRGESQTDVAGDLRRASDSLSSLEKYVPALEPLLVSYPSGRVAGMQETFHWLDYDLGGKRTFVLTHGIVAPLGEARVVMQRQFYVSSGYDAEQSVAAFLPVAEGTLVIYRNRTFAEPASGFGTSAKKTIGSGAMATKLAAMFEKQKGAVAAP